MKEWLTGVKLGFDACLSFLAGGFGEHGAFIAPPAKNSNLITII